jgi:hypothetical protein
MNTVGFFKDHQVAPEITHKDMWLLSRIAVLSAAALTFVVFSLILA